MSWLPINKASLPLPRPGLPSPDVPPKATPQQSYLSSSQSVYNSTSLNRHENSPSRPLTSRQPQLHVAAKTQGSTLNNYVPTSTAPSSGRSAPIESRGSSEQRQRRDGKLPATRKPQTGRHAGPSSSRKSNQPSAKPTLSDQTKPLDDDLLFFRLTAEELAAFRRKHRKSPTYDGFSDHAIAQELNRLGRGWDGYVRSRRRAEKEKRLDEFQRQFQTERRLMSTGLPLPAGAISMQAAVDVANGSRNTTSEAIEQLHGHDRANVDASKESSTAAVGLQQGPSADLGVSSAATRHHDHDGQYESMRDREPPESMPEPSKLKPAYFEIYASDSSDEYRPPDSTAMFKVDVQDRNRGRPTVSNSTIPPSSVINRSRPRRVETRPDYRIRRIRERRTEVRPKAASPTPRDLYDQSQPRFLQFKCEWAGCKAILNNVANIRKHVGIVHGQEARDTLCCNWGKCGRDDSTGVLSIFRCIEELEVHLLTVHMESLKWHLGDGRLGRGLVVKNSGTGDTSYLY